jgi:hypothetical protein
VANLVLLQDEDEDELARKSSAEEKEGVRDSAHSSVEELDTKELDVRQEQRVRQRKLGHDAAAALSYALGLDEKLSESASRVPQESPKFKVLVEESKDVEESYLEAAQNYLASLKVRYGSSRAQRKESEVWEGGDTA